LASGSGSTKTISPFRTLHVHQSELDPDELLSDIMIIADEVDAQLKETVRSLMDTKLGGAAA